MPRGGMHGARNAHSNTKNQSNNNDTLPQNHMQRRKRKRTRGQVIVRVAFASLVAGAFWLVIALQRVSKKSTLNNHKNLPPKVKKYHPHQLQQQEIYHDPMRRSIAAHHQDDDDEVAGNAQKQKQQQQQQQPPDLSADIARDMEESARMRAREKAKKQQEQPKKDQPKPVAKETAVRSAEKAVSTSKGKEQTTEKWTSAENKIVNHNQKEELKTDGSGKQGGNSPPLKETPAAVEPKEAPKENSQQQKQPPATIPRRKSAVSCPGKEHFVQILADAGKTDAEIESVCDSLPLWSEVTGLYGDGPVLHGLDTCAAFRQNLVDRQIPRPGLGGIKVAGMFNSGTNALALTLMKNMDGQKWHLHDTKISDPRFQALGFQPNVIWGKHSLLQHTNANRLSWEEGILPVVVIKDPYTWLHSMCKTVYDEIKLEFPIPEGLPKHCPSLVMTPDEKRSLGVIDHDNHVVVDRFSEVALPFPTMVDYWNSWYRQYYDAEFPRIMVRFEDTIFHAEAVTDLLAKCVEGERVEPFQYYAERAKKFKKANDFLKAIITYGTRSGRHTNMTKADLDYAKEKLDSDLMETFRYPH